MADKSEPQPTRKNKRQLLEMINTTSPPVGDFFKYLVNHSLSRYRSIIQTGGKEGQSYFSHVLDLVMTVERLRQGGVIELSDEETRCAFLACVVHDLNKVPPYADPYKRYPDIVNERNIAIELEKLNRGNGEAENEDAGVADDKNDDDRADQAEEEGMAFVDSFFPEWRHYLADITAIAQLHQGSLAITAAGLDLRESAKLRLGLERVKALGWIIQAADKLSLSHELNESRHKEDFLRALRKAGLKREWRFITHQLSENRGLLSNLIHNRVVEHLRTRGAVDLLYYPEGVAYLLPADATLAWSEQDMMEVGREVQQRIAELQRDKLSQFIKAGPPGIKVDRAALESEAQPEDIFGVVQSIVLRKSYKPEWIDEREKAIRGDLQNALNKPGTPPDLQALIRETMESGWLIPTDQDALKRGELAAAYRNFLEDHMRERLGKTPAWTRVYDLFGLPLERRAVYELIDPYRRGYFIATDITMSLDQMLEAILADLRGLKPASDINGTDSAGEVGNGDASNSPQQERKRTRRHTDGIDAAQTADPISAYLAGTLSVAGLEVTPDQFTQELKRYVTQNHRQCSNCSTRLTTQEWMAANAPPSIGVQSFSNRMEGGSSREPKRFICPVCRIQFILERLAWQSHRDKQGSELTTFYLHLFPYSFFTEPLLVAWYSEVQRLRDQEINGFFVDTDSYFRNWLEKHSEEVPIQPNPSGSMGVALPILPESIGNTPVLPIHARGKNYGEQFLQALETAVVLARYFGCRVLLSRTPVPVLTLKGTEAMFVDGMPRDMSWLVTGKAGQGASMLGPQDVEALMDRLSRLHKLRDELWYPEYKDNIVHDLASAAADDVLGLFHKVRLIMERKLSRQGGKGRGKTTPEYQMLRMSGRLMPYIEELVR